MFFFFSLLDSLSDLSLDLLSDSSSGLLSNLSSDSFSSEERKFKSSLIIFLVLFYFFKFYICVLSKVFEDNIFNRL